MNIEEIKTLMDLMVENDLSEIMIRDGEKRVILRRGGKSLAPIVSAAHAVPVMVGEPTIAAVPTASRAVSGESHQADSGLLNITSPMVGTYYAAPNPEAPPFVRIGDRVNPESVVCIIEAMKVFNEIKADVSGTIESILLDGGTPVEFGQVLIKVRPA